METLNVKAGDVVAVLVRDRFSTAMAYVPNRLSQVSKVTAKQIYLGDYRFDLWGFPIGRVSKDSRITNDASVIAELQATRDQRKKEIEERDKALAERDNRRTYQLACQLYGPMNTDLAIADLELLGEEYLQRIVNDIAKAKEDANVS